MTEFHDDFTELLGAYALDAVEPDERQRVEAHLHTCPWCAAEVAEHREVAAFLSHSGTDAPEGVWDRISAELSPPAPPMRLSFTRYGEAEASPLRAVSTVPEAEEDDVVAPNVVPLARRSVRMRTFAAVIGAAAVLLGAIGFVAVDQTRQTDQLQNEIGSGTIPQGPDDLFVKLVGDTADSGASAVVNPSGKGYLVSHGLTDPRKNELYQLWGQVDGVVLSLGTFDGSTDVVNFQVDPDQIDAVQAFAVTKERMPGVLASENAPVLVGEVA